MRLAAAALLAVCAATACKRPGAVAEGDAGADAAPPAATQGQNAVAQPPPPPDRPLLGITAFVATVYAEPRDTAKKLGYLRVGSRVPRSPEPAGRTGCPGGWYEIHPRGFVCAGKEATTDLSDPILKAASRGPNFKTALPYRYGFVRAVLPLYLRVPTAEEQYKSEFKLRDHLEWHRDNAGDVNKVLLGANDVAIDERGVPLPDKRIGELGVDKNSLETPLGVLLGGDSDADPIPFWLEGNKRLIPNISDFEVPEYAAFADRARRKTGLAFVGSFPTGVESLERRFAITTDMRLAPATKIKPDTGSPWHGVELRGDATLPLAFVRTRGARLYKIQKGKVAAVGEAEHRGAFRLSGKMRTVEGVKYYRTVDKRWLHQLDVGLALAPASWPEAAEKGEKWIEVSLGNQTLVLWEGKKPVYATLVSTGKAGIADPKTTTATIQGSFRIRNKHVTATMDSNESSSVGGQADRVLAASALDDEGEGAPAPRPRVVEKKKDAAPKSSPAKSGASKEPKSKKTASKDKKGDRPADKATSKAAPKEAKPAASAPDDYVPRKGDGMYGITKRRGEGLYKLRDVPYIQYFAQGYALHGAYWHDVFGAPRSHGCINLSPIDAHRVFLWTEPAVPEGWHAMNTGPELGEGTVIIVHE